MKKAPGEGADLGLAYVNEHLLLPLLQLRQIPSTQFCGNSRKITPPARNAV
jgi:hypothetical protein